VVKMDTPYKQKKDLFSLLREVNANLGRGPRQGLSVRPGQNKVLKILNHYTTMRQQDLLKHVGIQAGSLSELLGKLEKEEYISRKRNEDCKTEIIVDITEKGRISALENEFSNKERDIALFGGLDVQEKEALEKILNKLLFLWKDDEDETRAERRERQWKENAHMQAEQSEINRLLENI
jgi:DNA-binding MarR family transcriptional regulator